MIIKIMKEIALMIIVKIKMIITLIILKILIIRKVINSLGELLILLLLGKKKIIIEDLNYSLKYKFIFIVNKNVVMYYIYYRN
jgi:hypothetical protein